MKSRDGGAAPFTAEFILRPRFARNGVRRFALGRN